MDWLSQIKVPCERTPVFSHIPKTAMTSAIESIKHSLRESGVRFLKKREDIKKDFIQGHIEHKRKEKSGNSAKINKYIENGTGNVIFLHAHSAYTIGYYSKKVLYFVILRDPIERIMSHYRQLVIIRFLAKNITLDDIFVKNKEEMLYKRVSSKTAKDYAIDTQNYWYQNYYTKFLGAGGPHKIRISTEKEKDQVIKNLKRSCICYESPKRGMIEVPAIIGITERFEDTMKLFCKVGGWEITDKKFHESKTRNNKYATDYTPSKELIEEIKFHNKFDYEIYNTALEVFDKQLKHFEV